MIDNILSKSNSESKADGSDDEAKHTELWSIFILSVKF